jgi:hypothetical protein
MRALCCCVLRCAALNEVMSSKTEPSDAASSIIAGCENYVTKPLDRDVSCVQWCCMRWALQQTSHLLFMLCAHVCVQLLLRKVTTVLENINQKAHSALLAARAQKYKRLLEQTRRMKKERDDAMAASQFAAPSPPLPPSVC